MKKVISLSLFLLLFCFQVSAQQTSNALLYQVTKKGQTSPSYLFGTFHILCQPDIPTDSIIYQSLRSCKSLCLELDVSNTSTMMGAMKYMMDTGTGSWQQRISSDTLLVMDSVFKARTKMSLASMKKLKPFAVMTMMLPSFLPCSPQSIEMHMAAYAKAKGVKMAELETIERQMKALSSTPLNQQIDELKELMLKSDSSARSMMSMVKLYKGRRLGELQKMMEEQGEKGKTDLEAMLNSRNREWIPKMQLMMAEGPVFFAVGAGHLPGKEGVITLLQKQGYEVKPVW